jgi:hypothetical protein
VESWGGGAPTRKRDHLSGFVDIDRVSGGEAGSKGRGARRSPGLGCGLGVERRGAREGEQEDHLVWVNRIAGVSGGELGRGRTYAQERSFVWVRR